MHVREQIVRHVVEALSAGIPAAGGRVYAHGRVSWDRRTYPMIVVTGAKTSVTLEEGSDGRFQRRETRFVVEIHDLEAAGEDYVERLGDLSVAVESVLAETPGGLGIEGCEVLEDTGVVDIDEDERGVHAGTAITFVATYYTERGNASRMEAPNY